MRDMPWLKKIVSDPVLLKKIRKKAAKTKLKSDKKYFKKLGAKGGKAGGKKLFIGNRNKNTGQCAVKVKRKILHVPLPNCNRKLLHESKDFAWGDLSPSSAQLAFAILYQHFKLDKKQAFKYYMAFKCLVIAELKEDEWQLSSEEITELIKKIDGREG